jgi:hypothetical protein
LETWFATEKLGLAADVVFYLLAASLYRLVKHPRK